ncbi:MAG: helix-turn-helix transcriptional regulator [Candidatus Heimdallarchaeota archaeon]|nr:MAG: helix-turn-helix transcriptional regulator [Candidatus Heimdallarchaeota archaeon]
METSFDKPGQVIQVIEALADPTRRRMLLLMYRNAPNGLTASNLADMLRKKIPTILHHLKSLEELDLAYYDMQKIGGQREVKHWKVKHKRFVIDIDMDSIALPEDYIIALFEDEKSKAGIISEDFGKSLHPEEIRERLQVKFPDITTRQAEIIKSHLSRKRDLEHYLQQWIYGEFVNSAGALQLNFFEFGKHFALDETLRRVLFEKLMESQNFTPYSYTENGQVTQRMALRSEYLKAHRDTST